MSAIAPAKGRCAERISFHVVLAGAALAREVIPNPMNPNAYSFLIAAKPKRIEKNESYA